LEESKLVDQCKKGDHRAQKELYLLYSDRMFRLASRYVRNTVDAEDILVMAFTKVYSGIQGFVYRDKGSLEAWIRKVVVNESLMWLRRRHNFNLTETIEDHHFPVALEDFSQLPVDDILQFIAKLPIGYRTVFNLTVIEGFTHSEIAAMLEITESTSRTQLFKAKTLLKQMLALEGFHYGT